MNISTEQDKMSSAFDGHALAEKLSKLNNSQQSIESLSRWCIFHRKKAKRVVETWDKLYNSSQREQRVSFLYLANDILQNSRRKGSEFVNEFWKVLPTALKDVSENGDDSGKKAVSRLVDIWEERKVFGSRGRSLKEEILARELPPSVENNGKSSNSVKIVKKDAHSIRLKLALGSMPEKIVSAFQLVLEEHFSEDTALNKCKAAVGRVEKMEKDFDNACSQGNQQVSTLENELQEQENILQQCIPQLESAEATRAALVSQLKEALQDQESKLELLRSQLQVGQTQIKQASKIRQRFSSDPIPVSRLPTTMILQSEINVIEPNPLQIQTISTTPKPPFPQPVTSFATSVTDREEENKKATAAAVAAKLTASTSSLQMLSSVLSSLAAEEAASKNVGQKATGFITGLPILSPQKRPKLEHPMPVSDMGSMTYFGLLQEPQILPAPSSQASPTVGMHSMSQGYQIQPPFTAPPPPPPPKPVHHQFGQSSTGLSQPPPPPPPLPTHRVTGLAGFNSTQPQQQQQQQQQQQTREGGYYQQPMGMGFYGQNHQQPTPPPVPRQ